MAVPTLRALHEAGHTVCGVLSQPAKPFGRNRIITQTPVAEYARSVQIPVYTPEHSDAIKQAIEALEPDIAIVVAYGTILEQPVLDAVAWGWWNVHFSLLPRWRGAAPVQHSLLAGDTQTGITVFRIVEKLDAGPVFAALMQPIAPHDTAGSLVEKLSVVAPAVVIELLTACKKGEPTVMEQVGEVTFAPKLVREQGRLDLEQSVEHVYRRFQAVTPEPGATLVRSDNQSVLKVMQCWPQREGSTLAPGSLAVLEGELVVGTATSALVLGLVQPAGKKVMAGVEWFRGVSSGVVLGGA